MREIQPNKDPTLKQRLAGWRSDFFVREAHEVVKEESRKRKKEAVEIFVEEIGREEEIEEIVENIAKKEENIKTLRHIERGIGLRKM